MKINAEGIYYRDLNSQVRQAVRDGETEFILDNVTGHRYIGCGLKGDLQITVNGIPGNDLAGFMDGPRIEVRGNAQDGVGNTMNSGKVVIHGGAGDVLGHTMRGGSVYVRGDAGYRVGINMKQFRDHRPVLIIGGRANDYLGEYMAGGLLIVLGINGTGGRPIAGDYIGTGMHGGEIILGASVDEYQLGREVGVSELSDTDRERIKPHLTDYCGEFELDPETVLNRSFVRLTPVSTRPYGQIYVY
jgi:glutamate synthase domain-containing protein 3